MKKILLSSVLLLGFGWFVVNKYEADLHMQKHIFAASAPVESTQQVTVNHYKDGQYTGTVADAYYGKVQVTAVISQGKITEVTFLKYPQETQNSVRLNEDAISQLQTEAITIQSANVDSITGASLTSAAYLKSLSSALTQAQS